MPLFRDIYSTSIGRGLFLLTLSSAGPILAFASIESLKAGPKLPGLAWLPFLSFAVGQIYGQFAICISASAVTGTARFDVCEELTQARRWHHFPHPADPGALLSGLKLTS